MRLIQRISIHNLRSIQDSPIEAVKSLNAFVGKNSSGKSNVLRALNLFFNGALEPGKPIDFTRDHYDQKPRLREKKEISISVEFELPSNFRFRTGLEHIKRVGNKFTITRTWTLDQFRRPKEKLTLHAEGQQIDEGADVARQFLSMITFRYIPNRTIPSAILKDESQAIASSIFSRMKDKKGAVDLLQALNGAAARMLLAATESLKRTGSPIESPSVATQGSIAEMLTMAGFKATGAHGLPVQDEDWGAGHQAFFLYQVLCILDTSYGKSFGWKQATIWGVEEPEAALHRDLETRLAEQFRTWCLDPNLKLQIFTSTHSPIFSMASESGYWVDLTEKKTIFKNLSIPELTRSADERGVSGWVHPILYFPWNPVVLVEGPIDAAVLTHVSVLAGLGHLRFVSVPNLDPRERNGGKDKIVTFLKNSMGLVQNRSRQAPLIVLFDWEVSTQDLRSAKHAYGANADKHVFKMDSSHASTQVGSDFRGIERFYPPNIFTEAHTAGELILGIANKKPFSISQSELNRAKGALQKRILALDSTDKLKELLNVVVDIERRLKEGYPLQISLPGIDAAPLAN